MKIIVFSDNEMNNRLVDWGVSAKNFNLIIFIILMRVIDFINTRI